MSDQIKPNIENLINIFLKLNNNDSIIFEICENIIKSYRFEKLPYKNIVNRLLLISEDDDTRIVDGIKYVVIGNNISPRINKNVKLTLDNLIFKQNIQFLEKFKDDLEKYILKTS